MKSHRGIYLFKSGKCRTCSLLDAFIRIQNSPKQSCEYRIKLYLAPCRLRDLAYKRFDTNQRTTHKVEGKTKECPVPKHKFCSCFFHYSGYSCSTWNTSAYPPKNSSHEVPEQSICCSEKGSNMIYSARVAVHLPWMIQDRLQSEQAIRLSDSRSFHRNKITSVPLETFSKSYKRSTFEHHYLVSVLSENDKWH